MNMNKQVVRNVLGTLVIVAFLGGGYWYHLQTRSAVQPTPGVQLPIVASSTQTFQLPASTPHVNGPTSPPPSGTTASKPTATSGIRGLVSIGPTCPVQRIPPDPRCADRPFAANFRVRNSANAVVREFASLDDGTFSVPLPAGTYAIEQMPGALYPRISSQVTGIVVREGKFTAITIRFDSGIR